MRLRECIRHMLQSRTNAPIRGIIVKLYVLQPSGLMEIFSSCLTFCH